MEFDNRLSSSEKKLFEKYLGMALPEKQAIKYVNELTVTKREYTGKGVFIYVTHPKNVKYFSQDLYSVEFPQYFEIMDVRTGRIIDHDFALKEGKLFFVELSCVDDWDGDIDHLSYKATSLDA